MCANLLFFLNYFFFILLLPFFLLFALFTKIEREKDSDGTRKNVGDRLIAIWFAQIAFINEKNIFLDYIIVFKSVCH